MNFKNVAEYCENKNICFQISSPPNPPISPNLFTYPSFKQYVVVHQKLVLVSSFFKLNDKDWRTEDATELTESIYLQAIDVTLQLADIYRGIGVSA